MKILLAEDDDVSRMLLSDILASESGAELVAVPDGAAAWKTLDQQPSFDLAIFDVMMPELSGLDLVARLRRDRRFADLPVILCTALNDRATVTEAAALGIVHYIVKPYSRATVLEKIRAIIALQHTSDVLESPESVCGRLGIPQPAWHGMLMTLETSTARWIHETRQALRPEHLKTLILRANALQGACTNLGAVALATQLAAAEAALVDAQAHIVAPHGSLLSDPLILSELTSVAENIQRENQRLNQALRALQATLQKTA